MTVATTIAESSFAWTGVETVFSAGFPALRVEDVFVQHNGVTLTRGVHYTVAIDPMTRLVTVSPLGMPAAAGTVRIWRSSELTQSDVFVAGEAIPAATHEGQHDRHVLRLQELRRDVDRAVQLAATGAVVITRRQALKALKSNTTAGVNWLTAVQDAISPLENADDNIDFTAWLWPAGGPMWLRVQTILNSALAGGFTATQRAALEAQAAAIL